LPATAKTQSLGTVGRHVPEDVPDHLLVREPEHVIEVLLSVLGVAAGVRSPQGGESACLAEAIAEGIGELCGLGEGTDEDQINLVGQEGPDILEAGIADERDLVPFLLAPDRDHLRHDAGQVGMHDPRVQGARGSFGDQIDYRNSEWTQWHSFLIEMRCARTS